MSAASFSRSALHAGSPGPAKKLGYVIPSAPGAGSSGYEPGARPAGDGDDNLLALLDTTDKLRCILAQLAQTDGFHDHDSSTCATVVAAHNGLHTATADMRQLSLF